jgi:hypothetical protein
MRDLFTDDWNSFWHVVFGFLGSFYHPILFIFILYQLVDPLETNMQIDIFEGMIGFLAGLFLRRAGHQTQLDVTQISNNIPN